MRRAAKTDINQQAIVDAYRRLGASVLLLHRVGQGCPDICLGVDGLNVLQEIKMPKGKLTPDEAEWHESWRGQVEIVRSVDEAIERWEHWRQIAGLLSQIAS